jgi:hypothetical protein
MTKTDDVLKDLDASIPEYIKAVGEFQYDGKAYRLVDHFRAKDYLTCQVCGHEKIKDIYIVANTTGNTSIVGNVCIDKISNQKISECFRSYRQKRDTIIKNRQLIDGVDAILLKYEWGRLPHFISKIGIERLQKMMDRMCEGFNPLEKTAKLARYYMQKMAI